ncbi:hypothetical protein DL98DRAFT_593897 [Cadophora sp. DSE1049]|nr:hypothetical protein DL98DRAFT_593897 [Cadophora sp. DSE1049]
MAENFTIFNALPTELRLLIYEHSLSPRIIPLHCQIQCSLSKPGTYLYHSFLQPPSDRQSSRSRELPPSIVDIRVHFAAASHIEPATILQVCRESRQFAIQHGYRIWKLRDEFWNTRDVMWHAGLDIVSLGTPHRASIPRFYGELFKRQFPVEVQRVRAIAVPVASWKEKHREKVELGECWKGYTALRRIVVVMGDAVKRKGKGVVEHDTCKLVCGMRMGLGKMVEGGKGEWKVPAVLLVGGEGDILRAEEMEMRLDCDPCPSNGGSCKLVLVHPNCSE